VWKPWNGREFRIGVDPLVRSNSYYKLSRNLISTLKEKGIVFLANTGTVDRENTNITRWKRAEFLGLDGAQKEEWDNFIKGLIGSGFELNNEKDILLWSWDTKRGQVNAKQVYEVQMLEKGEKESICWYNELWTW
jgi:hypothetical protein